MGIGAKKEIAGHGTTEKTRINLTAATPTNSIFSI
jgi:hypothetical protein